MEHSGSEERIAWASKRFLDVVEQEGVQPLIRCASEVFESPVVLTDQLFHVRTAWPKENTGLPELDKRIRSGFLRPEVEWKILDENLTGQKPFYEPFYTCGGICAQVPRLYGELVWENEVRGHVIVFLGATPLRGEDKEILSKLLSLLCLKLHKNRMGLDSFTATLQSRLEVLLDADSPEHIRQPAIELLESSLKGNYGIMVTIIGRRASQKAFADYAVSQIQQKFRNVVVIVYDQAIVTLFGEVKPNAVDDGLSPESNELVRWLVDYFDQYDQVSGITGSFQEISKVYVNYRRALMTARMIEHLDGKSYAFFEDCMPMPLLAAIMEESETFIHPVLKKIRDYDSGNHTSLFQTLFVYTTNFFDKEKAAAELGIHKNTLSYRLARISELFLVDLDDQKLMFNLTLSCFLWKLSGSR